MMCNHCWNELLNHALTKHEWVLHLPECCPDVITYPCHNFNRQLKWQMLGMNKWFRLSKYELIWFFSMPRLGWYIWVNGDTKPLASDMNILAWNNVLHLNRMGFDINHHKQLWAGIVVTAQIGTATKISSVAVENLGVLMRLWQTF